MIRITLGKQLDAALQRAINAIEPAGMREVLERTGLVMGAAAESVVSEYPPPSGKPLPLYYTRTRADESTYKSKFKSAAQQAKVMALRKEGKIPYRRTGQLGRSITSRVVSITDKSVTVNVGTNLGAPYVIDRLRQSHYHRGNWTPLQTDLEKNTAVIRSAARNEFVRGIRARIQKRK